MGTQREDPKRHWSLKALGRAVVGADSPCHCLERGPLGWRMSARTYSDGTDAGEVLLVEHCGGWCQTGMPCWLGTGQLGWSWCSPALRAASPSPAGLRRLEPSVEETLP